MLQVSVTVLMDTATFNDLRDGEDKWSMFTQKFDSLTDEFIASVTAEGIVAPIIYDPEENVVYDGHHRILVAWLLGIEFLNVIAEFDMNLCDELEANGYPNSCR